MKGKIYKETKSLLERTIAVLIQVRAITSPIFCMFSAEITMSLSKIPLFTSVISWIPPIHFCLSAKTG